MLARELQNRAVQALENRLGLRVGISHLSLGWNAGRLTAVFHGVRLSLPEKPVSSEMADRVEITGWDQPLALSVQGLRTNYFETENGDFANPVWDRLIDRLSSGADGSSGNRHFRIDFSATRVTVKLLSGFELSGELRSIEDGGHPVEIKAALGSEEVTCLAQPAAGLLVDCTAPRLRAAEVREFLSEGRLPSQSLKEGLHDSALDGELIQPHFQLWKNGDFEAETRLENGVWSEAFLPLPPLRGLNALLRLSHHGPQTTLTASGAWSQTPLTVSLVSSNGFTRATIDAKFEASMLARMYPKIAAARKISGRAPVRVTLIKNKQKELQWQLFSDLRGIEIRLPKPLGKPAMKSAELSARSGVWQYRFASASLSYQAAERAFSARLPSLDLSEWQRALAGSSIKTTGGEFPALDVKITSLLYGGKTLGHFNLQTLRTADGSQIEKFRLENPAQKLVITNGGWTAASPHTSLKGWFETSDIGKTLDILGLPRKVEDSPFRAGFELNWLGAPWDYQTQELNGHVSAEIAKGRLNAISPTFRRVLSLAAVDLQGAVNGDLAFEHGGGRFEIHHGRLQTAGASARLDMRLAHFGFEGMANLNDMTVDAGLKITPLFATSLFNSALLFVMPAAGGAVYALEADENSLFNRLKTTRYHVTDSLKDPQFTFSGW